MVVDPSKNKASWILKSPDIYNVRAFLFMLQKKRQSHKNGAAGVVFISILDMTVFWRGFDSFFLCV